MDKLAFEINIVRGQSSPHGTPGKLSTTAGFHCDTMELEWRNNKSGESCIVAHPRQAWIWFSPTLKRNVVRLEDTDGRMDCLLHNGNFAGQATGEITQIHGCTEVGMGYGEIERKDGVKQWGIQNSGNTLDMLIEHIISAVGINGKFIVNHSWGIGCQPEDLTDLNKEK